MEAQAQVQCNCSVISDCLQTHGQQHTQDFLSITSSQSLLKLMSIKLVMPSNHLILHHPLSSCLQSFPSSGSFPVSQLFASGAQSIGASTSASVLPMSIQDWFPLGLTVWLPCWPRHSQESSPAPQIEDINSLVLSFFYCPALTSRHDFWRNHSSEYMNLCRQSNVSAF